MPARSQNRKAPEARSATVHQVAQRAGVSTATVSRVFSGAESVRSGTRDRVLTAARALGYRPNRAARSLVTGARGAFAMVLPDLARPHYAALAQAAARKAQAGGHMLAIADGASHPDDERALCEDLARRTDGLVLCASSLHAEDARALAATAPLVLTHRRLGSLPAVLTNERVAVARAAEHLRGLGHRRVAFVSAPEPPDVARERRRAVEDRNELECVDLCADRADFREGAALGLRVREAQVTAAVVFDDELALGLLAGLRDAGIDVPGQIGIAVVGDHPVFRLTHPPLTALVSPTDEMGSAAIELLRQAARGGPEAAALRTVRFEPKLVVRESTGPAARKPA